MTNFFGDVYGQLGSVWKKLTSGQKIVIVLVSFAVIAGVVAVVYWSSQLEMGVLFGNLPGKDAGAIQSKLQEENIPFKLRDGGQTILVPRERIYELRNQLTQEGLVQGEGQGMEIFDTMQLGMTEFLQNINLTRALEGELARTISWLNPVAAAKVHITRPKPTIFTELQKSPTASVTLKLVPGRSLSQREVLGISNIVASAVEGLDPANVMIVDHKGRLLTKNPSGSDDDVAGNQLEVKSAFESTLSRKVQEQLDGVVGANKVRVVVNVDLDHQKQVRTEKKFAYPDEGKVIKSEKINTQDSSTSHLSGGSDAGNLIEATNTESNGVDERSTTEDSEKEYAVNETHLDIVEGGAEIVRLSLAIMIDESLKDRANDIEGIIKQAVGFDEARGDSSTTAIMAFTLPDLGDAEEALDSFEQKEFILTLVKNIVQGLSVAGVVLILWIILKRSDKNKKVGGAGAGDSRSHSMMPLKEHSDQEADQLRIREEVLAAVQADPIMATDILHEWLKEE
ncbi:MAG: flagellar M-ring protein FliF [Planctomycetes bacterium]|nr:flagellar M-ring protein FliF [Planctomycetota bacterium]